MLHLQLAVGLRPRFTVTVSMVSRVRVRFSNVLRVRVEG